jgi:hypothetical protein
VEIRGNFISTNCSSEKSNNKIKKYKTMNNTFIEFDGYCPESKLKGELVEMRLNAMDFWESEKTGLQITTFPPYAAILQWRGEGKFKESKEVASDKYYGLLLAKAQVKHGCEIFPEDKKVFAESADLEEYIYSIYKSFKEFSDKKFKEDDSVYKPLL